MLTTISEWLFDSSSLTAHGFCLLWEPGLIWTYAISDIGIALAYFSIPCALAVVARRRRDLVFRPLLWLFATFILLCGTTHWLDLVTLWVPLYGLQALVKAATALVSVFTALSLWWLLPRAVTLPSPAQMREANAALLANKEQLVQAQKMEAVGQLTGGIAHDFNNMLQVVTSSLTLLERRIAQGRIAETGRYIAAMRQASDNAASLTNRLLAFSRRQALRPVAIEPDQLVGSLKELIRRTLGPGIRLECRLGDGLWNVVCDPNQLESTLLNLAINARDAMPDGGTLTISTADRRLTAEQLADHDARPGNYVEIEVRDVGTGMSPDILSRAFEPFFTTKPTGQGTGLGLSQVYGFVTQSGGVVRLDSSPGRGTSVRLYLPGLEKTSVPFASAVPSADVGPPASPSPGTVLVVEDQSDVRAQIAEVLTDMGCAVVEAEDGPSGLRVLQSGETFNLIVTDVGLPGLNGRQLADAARVLDPGVPILLITGYAGKALDKVELTQGMEVLRKPFGLDELAGRVRAMLAGQGLGSAVADRPEPDQPASAADGPTR